MDIKIAFAVIMFSGVAFLSRVLVAFIREAAVARRAQSPSDFVVVKAPNYSRRQRKLARLKPVDPYSTRVLTTH